MKIEVNGCYTIKMSLFQFIKAACKAARIYWRVCNSKLIMTKLHTRIMKDLCYHYKTTTLLLNENDNPVIAYWVNNSENSKHFVTNTVSEEVLKETDKYFKAYFDKLKEVDTQGDKNGKD